MLGLIREYRFNSGILAVLYIVVMAVLIGLAVYVGWSWSSSFCGCILPS